MSSSPSATPRASRTAATADQPNRAALPRSPQPLEHVLPRTPPDPSLHTPPPTSARLATRRRLRDDGAFGSAPGVNSHRGRTPELRRLAGRVGRRWHLVSEPPTKEDSWTSRTSSARDS